ncbi:LuxR family transcriptional regulator [Amphritea opalescens]|uniref:LuxR family transcriptional regulator n=1 Tax=Amphritea opalescens TaxID=2490544 RepID=A0A430KQY6_9GAMM|nr:helix-turn-helix transcriptional regulator [Amphritea opalescens]RTE65753.1 LuxR family transcriptional regulator [Amphritea opalescens]
MDEITDPALLDSIAEVIIALGSAGFPAKLLKQINHAVEVNHLSLVHLEANSKVTYVFSASDTQVNITKTMQQLYLSIYYRLDPNKDFLDHFENDHQILIRRLQPQDITDLDYRQLWYERMGIVDRLSILTRADNGLYCLNLFRTDKGFSDHDVAVIKTLSSVLSALSVRQTRLSGSLSSFMTRDTQIATLIERLETIDDSLTKREKEVCSRILLGMSSEGIALDLAIKMQSVQTYRKRAYARLSITSQNELFSLCLTHV